MQMRLDAGNAGCQAPADGRLAAAIATIRDNRFPIRDRVERNIKLIRRIGLFFPRQCKNSDQPSGALRKSGHLRRACRGAGENSNGAIVRALPCSGFIAADSAVAREIFPTYSGANPNASSKRLA